MEAQLAGAREPRIITNNGRLKDQSEKLASNVARLGGFRSRLLGSIPSTQPEQPKTPGGDGMMDVQDGLITEITLAINEFEDLMSQLEGVC